CYFLSNLWCEYSQNKTPKGTSYERAGDDAVLFIFFYGTLFFTTSRCYGHQLFSTFNCSSSSALDIKRATKNITLDRCDYCFFWRIADHTAECRLKPYWSFFWFALRHIIFCAIYHNMQIGFWILQL